MNTFNLTDNELSWLQVAIVAKAIDMAKHVEKYPSPATVRQLDEVEALRDRILSMTDEYYESSSRGDREDFHADG